MIKTLIHCTILRLACQVVNETQAGSGTSPGEMLSRRCVSLLKMVMI